MDKIKRLIVVRNKATVRKLYYIFRDISGPLEEWDAVHVGKHISCFYVRDLNAKKFEWVTIQRNQFYKLIESIIWADYVYIALENNAPGEFLSLQVQDLVSKHSEANVYRLRLRELTKNGIKNALSNPGKVDLELALSEKLRIEVNTILEYVISSTAFSIFDKDVTIDHTYPYILQKLIEREKKVRSYTYKPSFYVEILTVEGTRTRTKPVSSYEKAEKLLAKFQNRKLILDYATQGEYKVSPPGPFTFLSFIKFACTKYNKKTHEVTSILRSLYQKGRISFYDTNSNYISNDTVLTAWKYVRKFRNRNSIYKPKYSGQNIDKALQPINIKFTPKKAKRYLKSIELQFYTDIWCGVISTQCSNATILRQSVDYYLDDDAVLLSISGDNVIYGGWMNVASELLLEPKRSVSAKNCKLAHSMILSSKPSPPSRYTTTTLIQLLEDEDFADSRVYIEALEKLEKLKLISILNNGEIKPNARGETIIKWVKENIPFILSYEFIAEVESELYMVKRNGGYSDALNVISKIYAKLTKELQKSDILHSIIPCQQCSNKTQLTMDTGDGDPYVWCDNCDWWVPISFDNKGNEFINNQQIIQKEV